MEKVKSLEFRRLESNADGEENDESKTKFVRNSSMRRRVERMTPRQEVANAFTQLGPSLLFLHVAQSEFHWEMPLRIWLLMASVWLHLPFSFFYHVFTSMKCREPSFDPLRCSWRRLDNTFIHVSSACIAFGTSGSLTYFILCASVNAVAAALHWTPEVNTERNQMITLSCILLYLMPLLWYKDFCNLAGAFISLLPAGLCFKTYFLGGYSHAFFHILMTVFAFFALQGAIALPIPEHDIRFRPHIAALFKDIFSK